MEDFKKPTVLKEANVSYSNKSDGSTASYYELPKGATQLQDLISHKNMNAQIGEIFRACYRYGEVEHSPCLRDAKKIKFYIDAEIARLEALNQVTDGGPNPLYVEEPTPEMPEPTCCKHGTLLTQSCKYCRDQEYC